MKRFSLIILLGMAILLANCSKDNTDDSETNNSGNENEVENIDKSGNLLPTGASANDLLTNTNFENLLIEIAYVAGYRPTPEAMDNFIAFLRQHTFKQNITINYLELPSPEEETLELQEIGDLEIENRTAYNTDNTLAVYIYFADAPSDGDDSDEGLVTLGAVYRNTSMVIYEETIRSLASRSVLISNEDVETATLNHEFGHLFGLVDLSGTQNGEEITYTPMVNEHEDPEAADHCAIEGCLMRAELQFNTNFKRETHLNKNGIHSACSLSGESMLSLLSTQAGQSARVPSLDAECILDLQNNGGR